MEFGDVTLRPHQEANVRKLLGVRACLVADDKRTGKTITALAITLQRMDAGETGPVLIIADKPSPWIRDFAELGISPERLHLVDRPKRTEFKYQLEDVQDGHFYQIHWAGLVPELALLKGIRWFTIITDEFHAAKNRKAQRTLALKVLRTLYKIGLTADPHDNSPQDIWSLLNWLYPDVYTSFWRWVRKYVEVYKKTGRHGEYLSFGQPINVEEFRQEIEPFFVRTTLETIDPGQIPIIYKERFVTMTLEQAAAYRDMVDWQMMQLGDDLVIAEYPMIAAMRLQQLAQAMGRPETRLVWRNIREIDPRTGDMVWVRRQVETIKIHQIEPSPKLDMLMHILLNGEPGPTIIYSQFPGMLNLAAARMDAAGVKYVHVRNHGDVISAERSFQTAEVDIIVGSTGVMSESIKLDRASTVIFLDCPWNPRVRGQAIGRAKAVGKRTPITVIDIRTSGTVDLVRLDRARTKQQWRDQLLGEGPALSSSDPRVDTRVI